MGNQQIKDSLKKVQDKEFDDNLLSPHLAKLWSFDNDEDLTCASIGENIFTYDYSQNEARFNQHFPTQCNVEAFPGDEYQTSKVLRDDLQAAGFATSERRIDQLRQEDVKLLRVDNIEKSTKFEGAMNAKAAILTAELLMRHKGGDVVEDFLTYALKQEAALPASTSLGSIFDAALLCTSRTLTILLRSQQEYLKKVFEDILEQARGTALGALCQKDTARLGCDVKLKQLRNHLVEIARHELADTAMKTLAVRLILRLGMAYGIAEDMLLAADLQAELSLDVTFDLMPLLEKSEKMRKYVPPAKPGQGGDDWQKKDTNSNQSRVYFESRDDRTYDEDTAGMDDNYYYMWSHNRGLYKGKIEQENLHWNESKGSQDTQNDHKECELTFVTIDGKIHIRTGSQPDEPFVELDVETCKVKEGFQKWTSDDNLLNWANKEAAAPEGDDEKGYRYLRSSQMHYLDDELWIGVPYHESDYESSIKGLVMEVWTRNERHFSRSQEIPLYKEDGTTRFQGAKRRKHNYCNRGFIHKNSKNIIWHSGKSIHVFDRNTGRRIFKHNWNSTQHVTFYNPKGNHFHWMDCACYSYNYFYEISGYDPKSQQVAEAVQEVPLPIVLDEIKKAIKDEVTVYEEVEKEESKEEAKEEAKDEEGKEGEESKEEQPKKRKEKKRQRPSLNNLRTLMGLDSPPEVTAPPADVPSASSIDNIHAKCRAIIYSFCGVEANLSMKAAEYKEENPPFGDDMQPFFKSPFSVYLNRDFILTIMSSLKSALVDIQGESPDVLNQVRAFTLLHFIQASILSIKCCRMQANQILKSEDMAILGEMGPTLSSMKPLQSATGVATDDLNKEQAMSINISQLAKRVGKTMMHAVDDVPAAVKLQRIATSLNTSSPESAQQYMISLSDKDEMTKLYSDTGKLSHLLPVINGCCLVVNQSFKRVLASAVQSKNFAVELDSDFSQAAASLQSMLCKELCAAYGNQLLAILDNKTKAEGSKPDDMEEADWNKITTSYSDAVQGVKDLDKLVYQGFIHIAEHMKFQMSTLTRAVEEIDTQSFTQENLKALTSSLKQLFARDASILRSTMLFCLFFTAIEVDVTWLDEIAEGLRHATAAINNALLSVKSIRLESDPMLTLDDDELVVYLQNVLRQISYTIGWVAGRLIQQKQDENDELSKLNVLQGGIENRFIPDLSQPTKIQIEGSYKITGDKELQKLALQDASAIVLDQEDVLLRAIIENGDSVKLTLSVLDQALRTKVPMCPFARLGGDAGAEISRAAFAAIAKFTESCMSFEALNNQITQIGAGVQSDGPQKLKDIIQRLKEDNSKEYEAILKRWETANQMRKWTQQVKLSISERTAKEADEAYRQEVNEANPSAEPLTGAFNEEQKAIVEERANTKFDEELKKTYADVVQKAQALIKLQMPASYKAKKGKQLWGRLRSQVSGIVHEKMEETRKVQHILIDRQQANQQKDSEYDWTDRLKQWKKVQMAEGAIVDLGAKGQLNSQSASIAILGLLQSEYTPEQVNKTMEAGLVNGLRRLAGLNLLNYAMGLQGNANIFFDMAQWFSASLRQKKNNSAHFLDGLSGCGNRCESNIRAQFFKILKKVVLVLKSSTDYQERIVLLNLLCWNYRTNDHEDLGRIGLFQSLSKGDDTDLNWIKYYQGTYSNFGMGDNNISHRNLALQLQHTAEYVQNQVLAGIIETDSAVGAIESKQSQAKLLQAESTIDESATQNVINQMTGAVWDNLDRVCEMTRLIPNIDTTKKEWQRFNPNNYSENYYGQAEQKSNTVYADMRLKNPDIVRIKDLDEALVKRNKETSLKLDMLVSKIIKDQKTVGLTGALEQFLKMRVGPTLQLNNIGQIIEAVKSRDLVVQELLQGTSFEELGLVKPQEPEEEKKEEESKEGQNEEEWKKHMVPYEQLKVTSSAGDQSGQLVKYLLDDREHCDSGICKWVGNESKSMLTFTSKEPIRLSHFAIKSADDFSLLDPRRWKFYAVNEAGEQTLLQETDGEASWNHDRWTWKSWPVNYGENEFFAHKFVLDILTNNEASVCQIGQIKLYEKPKTADEIAAQPEQSSEEWQVPNSKLSITSEPRASCGELAEYLLMDALDGVNNSSGTCKWLQDSSSGQTLTIECVEPIRLAKFGLRSANDCPDRDPVKFSLDYENEDGDAIPLYDVAEDEFVIWDERWQWKEWDVNHEIRATKFVFKVKANGGAGATQLGQIKLIAQPYTEEEKKQEQERKEAANRKKQEEEEEQKRKEATPEYKIQNALKLFSEELFKTGEDQPHYSTNDPACAFICFRPLAVFRFLMQIEQVISISEKSPLIRSLVEDSLHPSKVRTLIEIAVDGPLLVQQLAQRIFQTLIRMEIPHEIFEGAIDACAKVDSRGNPTTVAKLLAMQGTLAFPGSKFLQLLCNYVQRVACKPASRAQSAVNQRWNAAIEATRTLRQLQINSEKYQSLYDQLRNQLKQALLTVDEKSDVDVETLAFIMGETRAQCHWNPGQAVRHDSGELYTVLNAWQVERSYLYFDPDNRQRQEVIQYDEYCSGGAEKLCSERVEPILDLLKSDSEAAARSSVLMEPEVVAKLITVAKSGEDGLIGSLSTLGVRSLQAAIMRGFNNMLNTLKYEYVEMLVSNNLFENLISYMVLVAGASSYSHDQQLRDYVQQDMKLTLMKQRWTQTKKFDAQKSVEIIQGEDKTKALIQMKVYNYDTKTQQVKESRQFDFVEIKQYFTARDVDKELKGTENVLATDLAENDLQDVSIQLESHDGDVDSIWSGCNDPSFLVSSQHLKSLPYASVLSMSTAKTIFTDDVVSMEELTTHLLESIRNDPNNALRYSKGFNEGFRNSEENFYKHPQIVTLAKADFDRIHSWLQKGHLSGDKQPYEDTLHPIARTLNELARRVTGSGEELDALKDSDFLKKIVNERHGSTSTAEVLQAFAQEQEEVKEEAPEGQLPIFKRNRLPYYCWNYTNLYNHVLLYENAESFTAELNPDVPMERFYSRQIDEYRVIMVNSRNTECKMGTWNSQGKCEWTDRAPRINCTDYPAICNDGTKWLLSIAGYNTTAERHNIENNTWESMPSLNVVRNAAAATVLNHVVYVFCGAGESENLNSIERLAMEGANGREAYEEAWTLIEPSIDILSRRYYPAVIPINNTEIAILGGYEDDYLKDVILFNTEDDSVTKVCEDADGSYYPNSNQAALIGPEEIVVLVSRDGNDNPTLITWKKGKDRIERIHSFADGRSSEATLVNDNFPQYMIKHANDIKNDVAFVKPSTEQEVKSKLATGIGAMFNKQNAAGDALPDFIELFSGEEEVSSDNFVNYAGDAPQTYKQMKYGNFYKEEVNPRQENTVTEYESLSAQFRLYRVLNESLCRSALMSILDGAGSTLNESTQTLLNQQEMTSKLDDLLHNDHMEQCHQGFAFANNDMIAKSKSRIINVLKLFSQSPTIKSFLVQDFFDRAKESITKFKNLKRSEQLTTYENFRSEMKLERILGPNNIILLSQQFIEQNYVEDAKLPETLLGFIDVCAVYSVFMDVGARENILRHAKSLIDQVSDNLALFRGKEALLEKLLSHKIFKTFISKISNMNELKGRPTYLLMVEIAQALLNLKGQIKSELGADVAVDLSITDNMDKMFTSITNLKDGTNFTAHMNKLKFAALREAGDSQIDHLVKYFKTPAKKFDTQIQQSFGPMPDDWTLRITKQTGNEFLHIESDDGKQIMVDKAAMSAGAASKIECKAGQKLTIKYPVKPSIIKWIGCLLSRNGSGTPEFIQLTSNRNEYKLMMETAAISPVQIFGASNHFTYVAADGSIYGMGSRIQGYNESEKFRKIEMPDSVTPADVKKVHVGKFTRFLWCHDGRFFMNGQHKWYMWGPGHNRDGEAQEKFVEQNKEWFRNGEDKIIDWVSGKHYHVVLTESGKMIGSGYTFYRNFESEYRQNAENYEDWPFVVKAPEGYTHAIKAFPVYKNYIVYVNWKKEDGTIRTFRIGCYEGGSCNYGTSGRHAELELPAGRYFTHISATRNWMLGICDHGKLWIWGNESQIQEYFNHEGDGEDIFDRSQEFSKPVSFRWFNQQEGLKVLDVKTGWSFAIIKTQNAEGKKEFYGFGKQEQDFFDGGDSVKVNKFGSSAKKLANGLIHQIVEIDAEKVVDFACTYAAVAYLIGGDNKSPASIVPDKPDAKGLIHFYKQGGSWKFVTEDELEAKKADLPKLTFATRHPIRDFNTKEFADLDALQSNIAFADEGEPTYYSKYTLGTSEDESVQKVTATEQMALGGSEVYDMNPIIFIRASTPIVNEHDALPQIKLTDFFSQMEEDQEISYSIQKSKVTDADLDGVDVRDEASHKFLSDVKNFTQAQDAQLILEVDTIAKGKGTDATSIKPRTIQASDYSWSSESPMAKKGEKVLQTRIKLLLTLIKAWQSLEANCDLKDKNTPGSIANLLFAKKYLIPPTVLSKIVDKACDEVSGGYSRDVSVSRRKAMVFADSGKIDHEGKYSMFGQIIQQLKESSSDMSNFRIKSTDERCYSIRFLGEGSIDAGGPFRESLTNIATELEQGTAPILIRSPNNKNEHGINRECFILDSRSKSPSHKFMFKYFGGFLAFAFLSKSPIPFNLAPWVWKQLLLEDVTIQDLEGIDAYSSQVLRDLENYAQSLSDEAFEAGVDQCFTTVLSSGEEVPLCEGGESKQVTKENIAEFTGLVLEARKNEAKEQVEAIREGFLQVIEQKQQILDFLDWQTFENRVTGEKTISMERLKTITTFPNNDQSHQIIARWWRVFESMTNAERTAYLKFVWGRSRLPVDLSNLNYKHQVRLMTDMNKNSFPQAHTCFFQLDVPDYETDEMMKSRVCVAAELCGEMDTDNTATEDLD